MLERWTMAPWMRRRLARHVERGSSDRVIACLITSALTPTAAEVPVRPALGGPAADYDLSNVILFRALAVRNPTGAASRAP